MQAIRWSCKDKTLELKNVEKPEITKPNDILVKVAFAGICGTDMRVIDGEYPCKASEITLGHEISGVIVDVGHDVIKYEEGDKVVIYPHKNCRQCIFCKSGRPQFCKIGNSTNTIGIWKDGGWAEYVICSKEQVYKISKFITLDQAVLAEPVSCLIHGWDILSPVSVGNKILILGASISGSLWASSLHLQGHRNATVCDSNSLRLSLVRKLNTGYNLVTPEMLRKNFEAYPDKYRFDVIIDCSSNGPVIEQAIRLLEYGGKFLQFSVVSPEVKVEISPYEVFSKELKILGAKQSPNTFAKALQLIEAMGTRYVNYSCLGIKSFPLNEYKSAIEMIKTGKIVKGVFKL